MTDVSYQQDGSESDIESNDGIESDDGIAPIPPFLNINENLVFDLPVNPGRRARLLAVLRV